MEKLNWKTIVTCLIATYLFVNLPIIVDTASSILTNAVDAVNHILQGIIRPARSYRSDTQALARLCVFGIVVVIVLKLFKKK